jgi:hypothetical protein
MAQTVLSITLVHWSRDRVTGAVPRGRSGRNGTCMLRSFVAHLVVSNARIAVCSTFGCVSSSTKRNVYLVIGMLAGVLRVVVRAFLVLGPGLNCQVCI